MSFVLAQLWSFIAFITLYSKKLGGLYNLLIFGTMTPVSYTGIQGITYEYK